MNLFKIRATIYRDIREYFTNYAVITILLMPPIMALMYSTPARNIEANLPEEMLFILLGTVLASVATNIPLMLYAEENEHGLLRMVTHTVPDLISSIDDCRKYYCLAADCRTIGRAQLAAYSRIKYRGFDIFKFRIDCRSAC